jgi:lipid-binding SYLF domain-containing protein
MLLMNEKGMRRLMQDKVTLGAEATVAAGPVGRSTAANTDAQLSAEILSWSRSKGLFAGIALQGATLRPDRDVNQELYGSKLTSKDILMTGRKIPEGARPLIQALNRYSRYEDKDKPIESRAADAITGDADRAKTKK